jgi:hypothetical protein
MKLALSILLTCACAASSVSASSCVDEVVAPIHFAKGAVCWYYAGKATHFTGIFSRGQRVVVEMSGEVWSVTDPALGLAKPGWTVRRPQIVGPHRFYVSSDPPATGVAAGRLETVLPESGEYKFGFSPCAMWHQYGHVAICTAGSAE